MKNYWLLTDAKLPSGSALTELEELLLESVASEQEAAKLCAAQWASRLFPASHMPSRYVCVMAAGDTKLEVREAGSAGLRIPASKSPGKSALHLLNTISLCETWNRRSCMYLDQLRCSYKRRLSGLQACGVSYTRGCDPVFFSEASFPENCS